MIDLSNMPLKAIFVSHIQETAQRLETFLADFLLPPPPGLYTPNRLEPAILPGRIYYGQKKKTKPSLLDKSGFTGTSEEVDVFALGVDNVDFSIYDEDWNCVVPLTLVNTKKKQLRSEPYLPYHSTKILFRYLRYIVFDQVKYVDARVHERNALIKMLLDCCIPIDQAAMGLLDDDATRHIDTEELYETMLMDKIAFATIDLVNGVEEFIGQDDWHVYSLVLEGKKLTVNKFEDYRIQQWTEEHGHERR